MDGDAIMENIYEIFNETEYKLDDEIVILNKLLEFTLEKEKLNNVEFNVIFINEKTIQDINKNYRNIDDVTDVISFALEDTKTIELDHRLLGDIYICIERAKQQAIDYKHSFLRELSFLTIHGLLHLLGYDHTEAKEEKEMFDKQEEILNEFGIRREDVDHGNE